MKLIVKYSENGKAVPDLKVGEWFEDLMGKIEAHPESTHTMGIEVGTETMINAIRLAIFQERLNHEDVTIQFKDQEWQFEKCGGCHTWPHGFCDTNSNYYEHLLGWDT